MGTVGEGRARGLVGRVDMIEGSRLDVHYGMVTVNPIHLSDS